MTTSANEGDHYELDYEHDDEDVYGDLSRSYGDGYDYEEDEDQ